jgi:hypothetical protein
MVRLRVLLHSLHWIAVSAQMACAAINPGISVPKIDDHRLLPKLLASGSLGQLATQGRLQEALRAGVH